MARGVPDSDDAPSDQDKPSVYRSRSYAEALQVARKEAGEEVEDKEWNVR